MDKYIGRLLDNRYEILEIIGTGGMAVVYKARCHRLNRLVAIKILKDDFLEDEDFRRRFHSESQAVAMLSHPNIVSVYDVSTSVTADYIVMELIEGISLKQYMEKKGVLNWKETLHFAIQIAKALEHAHSRGIVHRDIKPHNVMVLKNGSVKVTDFGIARMMSKGNTLTKEALGSVHYISPEQAKGGRVDNRSDIYSLGVVMYEMMSGRPPYDGESPVAVAIQHINGGAIMPSILNPNIPGGLEQIIMKAMAHDPADRYLSATSMLTDMDEFRKDPAILFDYNTPPLDAVTKLPKPNLVVNPRRAGNERVSQGTGSIPVQPPGRRPGVQSGSSQPSPRRRSPSREEERPSNVATIAIVVCSLVAVIAIGIFLAVLLGSNSLSSDVQMTVVPQFIGEMYEELHGLPISEKLDIRLLETVYDDQHPAGQVIAQEPMQNTQVPVGTTVFVTVSKGSEPKPMFMENLLGLTAERADEILNNLSLNLDILVLQEYHETVQAGSVFRTVPEEGTELHVGQKVVLYVSLGQETEYVNMPNLVGYGIDTAMNILMNYGFPEPKVEFVYSAQSKDEVVWQSVERNTKVDVTTVIALEVSKGPEPTEETEPDETDPLETEPEETEPELVTKKVVFSLPEDYMVDYILDIYLNDELVQSYEVKGGTESITVTLTGTGKQSYNLWIAGKSYSWEEVDFTTNE